MQDPETKPTDVNDSWDCPSSISVVRDTVDTQLAGEWPAGKTA